MGLLDDAIREHLELMRRHGADAAEVQQLEHEALGPVRRDRDFASPVAPTDTEAPQDAPAPGAVPAATEAAPAEPPGQEPMGAGPVDLDATRIYEQPVMPEPPGHEPVSQSVPAPERAAAPNEDPAPEERPAAVPMREPADAQPEEPELWLDDAEEDEPASAPPSGQQTTAFSAAEVAAAEADAEGPPADEDVLEETPDFLQETPEHERLWFEQRPPRNFDFDQ